MTLLGDLRYGLRILLKHPLATLVAILTLALGIGANTAMYGLLRSVLVSNFQYKDLDTLVIIQAKRREGGGQPTGVSMADMLDFQERSRAFEGIGTFRFTQYVLPSEGTAVTVRGILATPNLFPILGVPPVIGRFFRDDEGQPGNELVAILSEGYWTRELARDPSILGKTVRLNGRSHSVVGVMPIGFFREGEIFTPLVIPREERSAASRGERSLRVWARLKPGVTAKQAESDLTGAAADLAKQFPETNKNWTIHLQTPKEVAAQQFNIAGVVYFLPVAFVLLIACANVAHLQLARALEREKEVALRTALGAGRFRIMRQLLAESIVIGLLGGVAGIGVAWYGMHSLETFLPPEFTRGVGGLRLNREALGFMFSVAALSGVLFGIVPAWKASRVDLNHALKEASSKTSTSRSGKRFRNAMLISEIAMTTMLLGGAGLALSMVGGAVYTDMGFNHKGLLSAATIVQTARYAKPDARRVLAGDLTARLRAVPGVRSVAVSSGLPMLGGGGGARVLSRPGENDAPVRKQSITYHPVDENYFRTLEVAVTGGRAFTDADRDGSPPVAIVNEELVRQYFPAGNPLGQQIVLNPAPRPGASPADPPAKIEPPREIVGVVKNVKQIPVDILPQPAIAYVPYAQDPMPFITIAVRAENSAAALTMPVSGEIQAAAPGISIFQIGPMEKLLSDSLRLFRFLPSILTLLALLGLALAGVGTYGTASYSMAQRTQEFGIRMALGARAREVLGMVMKQGLKLTAIGFALGAAGTWALVKILVSLLPPQGPEGQQLLTNAELAATFGTTVLLLGGIALLANYIPARRATAIDPLAAIRQD